MEIMWRRDEFRPSCTAQLPRQYHLGPRSVTHIRPAYAGSPSGYGEAPARPLKVEGRFHPTDSPSRPGPLLEEVLYN